MPKTAVPTTVYEGGQNKIDRLQRFYDPTKVKAIVTDEDVEGDASVENLKIDGWEVVDLPKGNKPYAKAVLMVKPLDRYEREKAARLAGILAEDGAAPVSAGDGFDMTQNTLKRESQKLGEVIDSLPEDLPED